MTMKPRQERLARLLVLVRHICMSRCLLLASHDKARQSDSSDCLRRYSAPIWMESWACINVTPTYWQLCQSYRMTRSISG